MSLFTPDLYRQFAFGFIAGALIAGAASAERWSDAIESAAQAATPYESPQPAEEFRIEPLDTAA